ncbi:hypothetical protein FRC06_000913 [Ceratobasidium sp. 370]|nr:hypothetical protein FRC06_000913 [Ceratobasidium sp. 370]
MTTLAISTVCRLRCISLPEAIPPGFNPGVGGMYATADKGLDQPIEVGAQVPDLWEYQTWRISSPNEAGECQILFAPSGAHIELITGFANTSEVPSTPIVLSATPSFYQVRVKGSTGDGNPIVTIHPVGPMFTPDFYVGVSKENIVELQVFPEVIPGEKRPGWIVYG